MIPLPKNGIWTQKNESDIDGDIWASFNLDTSENPGRVRLGRRLILNTSSDDVAEITGVPTRFMLCGTKVYTFAGASGTGYAFSNDGTLTGAFTKDTTTGTLGTTVFGGSGLNDATYGGVENSYVSHTYIVQIDSTGTPDTFKWNVDGGSFTTGVAASAGAHTLANGVTITFAASTGHTLNASWTVTTQVGPTKFDSTYSDAIFANNAMYVICINPKTSLLGWHKKVGNQGWTQKDFSGSLGTTVSGYPNMLEFYPNTGRIYMSWNQSQVASWGSNDSVSQSGANTLTINAGGDFTNVITKILSAKDKLWILCVNTAGGIGFVYDWDGIATNYSNAYHLESSGAIAGVIKDDVPYILDTNGVMHSWNGGSFKKVTGFWRKGNKFLYNPVSLVNNRYVHPHGMCLIKGRITIQIDNKNYDNTSTIEETISSGVWEFVETTTVSQGYTVSGASLIHKHSVGRTKSAGTIIDYGQTRISQAGGITELTIPSNAVGENGSFMLGCAYYSDATTVKYGIFYDDKNDTLQKSGYIVTSKIPAEDPKGNPSVKNAWNSFYTMYRKLLDSNDMLTVKFRTEDKSPTEAVITWTSTTTFTTTTNISSYWVSGTGGEVEVIQGIGAGKCSHITSIVNNAGTYTVTVDQIYTGAAGTAKARFQTWKQISQIENELETYDDTGSVDTASWVQFKVWILFTGKDEIERLFIINSNYQPAN